MVGGSIGAGAFSSAFSSAFDVGGESEHPPRIYPCAPEQNFSLPYIKYAMSGIQADKDLNGPTGLRVYGYAIDVYAVEHLEVEDIAEAVCGAIEGWQDGNIRYGELITGSTSTTDLDELQFHLDFEITAVNA